MIALGVEAREFALRATSTEIYRVAADLRDAEMSASEMRFDTFGKRLLSDRPKFQLANGNTFHRLQSQFVAECTRSPQWVDLCKRL